MEMPQSSVEGLGWIFISCLQAEGKPSIFLQTKHHRGYGWTSSKQGQQALWGLDPGGEGGMDAAAQGGASILSGVFRLQLHVKEWK